MKGLQEYIDRYGKHFTDMLCISACPMYKWNLFQIKDVIKNRVYFDNGSTLGDIVYLVNRRYWELKDRDLSKGDCIRYALFVIEKSSFSDIAFSEWLSDLVINKVDFDFTPYI